MKEDLSNQKKFMSSKELYFLPLIREVKVLNRPSQSYQKLPPYKHRSIEQIIEKKDYQNVTSDRYDSFVLANRSAKHTVDLYNKYGSLPNIYMHRNRKQNSKNEGALRRVGGKKQAKWDDNEETKIEDEGYVKNKDNSFNFNELFYKEHFNRRLQEETQKIEFKLTYNYSDKQFLGGQVLQDDTNLSDSNKRPVKYTRIDLSEQQVDPEATLQKVPQFLMRLLQPRNSMATA